MQLTALQVADVWIAAGGPENRAVEWTAIALGESSYNTTALSPADCYGLWQILYSHAAEYGYSVDDLYNPLVNAKIAVKLSGGGTNCAAWDSCYANIYKSGRYTYLPWPEQGSADYNNLQVVSVALGRDKLGGQLPPQGSTMAPAEAAATAQMQRLATSVYPALIKQAAGTQMLLNRTYNKGWRP